MDDKAIIRPFTLDDQDRARVLILNGLAEHFSAIDPTLNPDLKNIASTYMSQGSQFLVAELDGMLVGTGAIITESEEIGRIVRVSVARSHRRMGIGRLLTKQLIEVAHSFHFNQIVVETNDDWTGAIHLYQQCGFTEYDRRDGEVHMVMML